MSAARPRGTGVLVIHPGALGDLVQALPQAARLRAAAGAGPLRLLVGASHLSFARGRGLFDDVVAFDDAAAYHGGPVKRAAVLAAAARLARRGAPALAVAFKASPVYAALARASGAPVRAGLTRGRVGARLLTHPVRIALYSHWEERYAALVDAALAAVGADPAAVPPPAPAALWPPAAAPDGGAAGDGALAGLAERARAGALLIAVAPGGARNAKADLPQKRWPAERFGAVVRSLASHAPDAARAELVVLGGPADRADAARCVAACPPELPVHDLVGRTSVDGARRAIEACAVFLGNDSALLHVAATTATPTVAVFGPTDPRAICPRAPSVVPVWHPARATPCFDDLTGRVAPCTVPCCMDRVTVADVAAAARPALPGG